MGVTSVNKNASVKVLVTGFSPFPGAPENPTQTLVERLKKEQWKPRGNVEMRYETLPTEYTAATEKLVQLLHAFKPNVLLQLGLSASATGFMLEQLARNVCDPAKKDQAGKTPKAANIMPDGSDTYESKLPLRQIHQALTKKGLPVSFSESAGDYVCNYTFYQVMHHLKQTDQAVAAGFVHIPYTHAQRKRMPKPGERTHTANSMAQKDLVDGLKTLVRTLVANVG